MAKNKISFKSISKELAKAFTQKPAKKEKKFDNGNLERLKVIMIIVKKGHGIAINNLLLENGVSMTSLFFAEGTRQRYITDIFGGEESHKEAILAVVPEKKYRVIKNLLINRFSVSNASKGVMLAINIEKMVGVLAYKYLSDYEGVLKYGKK